MKHSDYITHIHNLEDRVYLVNRERSRYQIADVIMRLFYTSLSYKKLVLDQCEYIRFLAQQKMEGYKRPHGMSAANAGLAWNIIGVVKNRNTEQEFVHIMINPRITATEGNPTPALTNCGSIILDEPITIFRYPRVRVHYYDEMGEEHEKWYHRKEGSFTIQHEIDHNMGILITDYPKVK